MLLTACYYSKMVIEFIKTRRPPKKDASLCKYYKLNKVITDGIQRMPEYSLSNNKIANMHTNAPKSLFSKYVWGFSYFHLVAFHA